MEDETLTFLENHLIATFLLSQLEAHARTITMRLMGSGSVMLIELRKKSNHLTPQLKLEMYQLRLALRSEDDNRIKLHGCVLLGV